MVARKCLTGRPIPLSRCHQVHKTVQATRRETHQTTKLKLRKLPNILLLWPLTRIMHGPANA